MTKAQDSVRGTQRLESSAIAELQSIVTDAAASSGVVGAQVSVILGDVRADLVHGSANRELHIPMTADTIVQVGSVCKVFNAALIMTLVEEGKLELDTPVIEYVPDLRLADELAQETITLRQLLSMSSGIDNGPYNEHGRGEDALGRYVASLADVPQVFPPGQGFGYSNAGTSIAGYVAERVMGQGWDALIKQRIFEPAELTRTLTLAEELPFHRVSAGHAKAGPDVAPAVVRPWCITRAQGPSGSTLTMSGHDLASFGQIFVDGGKGAGGRRVLSEASVQTMMTPTTDVPVSAPYVALGQKWGIGPSTDLWDGTVVWGHGGGNRSGASLFFWCPEKRAVLAVVVNTPDAAEQFFGKVLADLSRAVFGAAPSKPVVPELSKTIGNAQRFIGVYERYGTRYEVTDHAGRLHLKEVRLGSGKLIEQRGLIQDSPLVPLGDDRFLLDTQSQCANGVAPLAAAVGFFGNDERGRAANVVTPFLAARRTS